MAKKIKIDEEVKKENKGISISTIILMTFLFIVFIVSTVVLTETANQLENNNNLQERNYQPLNNENTQAKIEEKVTTSIKIKDENKPISKLSKKLTKTQNLLLCYQKAKECANKPIYNKDLPQEAIDIAKSDVEYSYKDMCNFLKDYENSLLNYTKTMCD